MSQFVESLARLYAMNKIDEKKIKELLMTKKINQQEYDYITAEKVV
jgi:hypothetical protein